MYKYILMPQQPVDVSQPSQNVPTMRRARLEDFLDCDVDDVNGNENKQHNQNNEYIPKNQRNYGHTKRIKP